MNHYRRSPNFLPQQNRLRLLQAGALAAVMACIVTTGLLLNSTGVQTAAVSDALSARSASVSSSGPAFVRPKAVSEHAAVSIIDGRDRDTVKYYERETGKAFSVNLRTLKTEVLSDVRLPGFIRSYWLPFSDKVVSEFQDPSGISYRMYDYQTKTTATIASDITSFAVSPDGRQVAYIQPTADASELFVSDNDGRNPLKLLTTRAQQIQLGWPAKNAFSIVSQRTDRTGADLSLVGLDGTLAMLITDRENLEYAWSPDGKRLLYSYYTPERGVSLWYKEAGAEPDIPLGLPTSARKCAWHGNALTVTCGVPKQSSLTRDVPADRSATVDDIVTLNLLTGEQKRLYNGSSGALIGVIDPFVTSSGQYFVFTNVFDQHPYFEGL